MAIAMAALATIKQKIDPAEMLSVLENARLIKLPKHTDANGDGLLVVAEAAELPFRFQRMFTIAASAGAKRGEHAHRLCSQFIMCVSGAVDVVCDDGSDRKTFLLDRSELALLVPPGLWIVIDVRQDNSVLIVLCDRPYEPHDYIRDYADFLSLRKAPRA
jgi:dTDP-4-dehydrorhamnose 3,5-epimerase-like enzyme